MQDDVFARITVATSQLASSLTIARDACDAFGQAFRVPLRVDAARWDSAPPTAPTCPVVTRRALPPPGLRQIDLDD